MNNIILYPGTFDPVTNGHQDLVERAAKLFDQVVVAIAVGDDKKPTLPVQERLRLAKQVLSHVENVEVCSFGNLLIDFAQEKNASVILRGLRAVSDFEYEFQLAGMNRRMMPEIETLFLTPAEQYTFISSSLVREIAKLGGDVSPFVHQDVVNALQKHYQKK